MLLLSAATADEWETASDRAVVPLRVDKMSRDFRGSLARYELLDGVGIVVAKSHAHALSRTSALIDSSPDSGLILEINVEGTSFVSQNNRDSLVRPGESVLYDTAFPYSLSFPDRFHCYLLHLPRESLALRARGLKNYLSSPLPADLPELRLLRNYLSAVVPVVADHAGSALRNLVTRSLTDLAALMLQRLRGAAPYSGASLLMALQETVRRELSNPLLSPEWLARKHLISRRQVYTVFNGIGQTPVEYIKQQRMTEALRLLPDPSLRVADIALACGFDDVGTFTRVFQRAFGQTPSGYRAVAHR